MPIDVAYSIVVRPYGALRGAAQRHHLRAWEGVPDLVRKPHRDPVAAEKHQTQRLASHRPADLHERHDHCESGRRRVPDGDVLLLERVDQTVRLGYLRRRRHPYASACGEHSEDVIDRQIEAKGCNEKNLVGGAHLVSPVYPVDKVHHRTMGDDDSLRCAGRSGGKDGVADVLGGGTSSERIA